MWPLLQVKWRGVFPELSCGLICALCSSRTITICGREGGGRDEERKYENGGREKVREWGMRERERERVK